MILLPGTKCSRVNENGELIGGVATDSRRLLSKAIAFAEAGMSSVRDHAVGTARELGLIADEVRV